MRDISLGGILVRDISMRDMSVRDNSVHDKSVRDISWGGILERSAIASSHVAVCCSVLQCVTNSLVFAYDGTVINQCVTYHWVAY